MHVGRPGDTAMSKTVAIYFHKHGGSDSDGDTSRIEMKEEKGLPCYINFTDRIVYLGSVIHQSLSSEYDIDRRIQKAKIAFGALRKDVMRSNFLNLKLKGQVFNSIVASTLLYGCENWTLTQELFSRLRTFFNKCVRQMVRCTHWRLHACQKVHGHEMRAKLFIASFDDLYARRTLRWVGQLVRMPMSRLPRLLWNSISYDEGRPVRGNWANYHNTIKHCLKSVGLTLEEFIEVARIPSLLQKATRVVSQPVFTDKSEFKKTELTRSRTGPGKQASTRTAAGNSSRGSSATQRASRLPRPTPAGAPQQRFSDSGMVTGFVPMPRAGDWYLDEVTGEWEREGEFPI